MLRISHASYISYTHDMISLDSLPAPARQAFQSLQAENARLAGLPSEIARLEQVIADQSKLLQIQDEKIRLLNFQLWGPKGEKLSPAQTALLFEEASVTAAEVQQEAQRPDAESLGTEMLSMISSRAVSMIPATRRSTAARSAGIAAAHAGCTLAAAANAASRSARPPT